MKELPTAQWRKSTYSGNSGNCVEVRLASQQGGRVGIRDSKHVAGPELTITGDRWVAFVWGIKQGRFNITDR